MNCAEKRNPYRLPWGIKGNTCIGKVGCLWLRILDFLNFYITEKTKLAIVSTLGYPLVAIFPKQ